MSVGEAWRAQFDAARDDCKGRSILDNCVPTPFVYVDLDVLEANVEWMASLARSAGVALRPHVKTHKLAPIARMQLDAGAVGLTVAKLSEAEALVDAGVRTSYLVAHPFWSAYQIERLLQLDVDAIVSVDSIEFAERLSAKADRHARVAHVAVVVDTGYHRFGLPPKAAIDLALRAASLPAVEVVGIRSHAGHVYGMPFVHDRRKASFTEVAMMTDVASALRDRGLPVPLVSVGSTPGAEPLLQETPLGLVNEVRPGNYVFFDRIMVSLGVTTLARCALRVVSTVVSSTSERAIIDAGKLTLSSTRDEFGEGYGAIVGHETATILSLSQECAIVSGSFGIGQRIVLVPNHACEITNLAPAVFYGRGSLLEGVWNVDARACVW